MKFISSIVVFTMLSLNALASMKFINSSNVDLGHFSKFKCATGLTCAQSSGNLLMTVEGPLSLTGGIAGDGGDQLYGFLQNHVTATATTITAAQCGSTFKNSGAVAINLPEASTVIGCRLTFITANASNFDVNPDNADQILVLTNAAGDAIRNATLGNSVVLEAISASQWAPVGKEQGTYTDIN